MSIVGAGFDLFSLLITLVVCALAGFIASAVMGQSRNSWLSNLLLGFGGAFVAGFLARLLGIYFWGPLSTLIFATLGAMLLIWAWQKFIQTNAASGRRF